MARAESRAARVARARLVDSIKALEHARQILLGNAWSLIG